MAIDAALQTELHGLSVRANQGSPAGLSVHFPSGTALAIHPFWLRERSRDPDCLDARTEQRLYNPSDLDPDLAIVSVTALAGDVFAVSFSDGHRAIYSAAAITAELADIADAGIPKPAPWTGSLNDIPQFEWCVDPDDAALAGMLKRFLVHGFIILKGVPCADGSVLKVARTFGFPRETNFGALFDVRSTPDAEDLAYTALALDPHTDNPYRAPAPGIQLLHCLANRTLGGLSTLVDGLAVTEALGTEDPDALAILSHVKVAFRYVDNRTELVAAAALIERDEGGRFIAIHYSPRLDCVPLLPPDELSSFYRARRTLDRMLRSERFELRFRLEDGDLMMFDNRRLLHGRTAFDPAEGLRHLQGCYIDSDGPRSLYRVLRRRMQGKVDR
jgi:gamma-butyrobetaine dioxygenase